MGCLHWPNQRERSSLPPFCSGATPLLIDPQPPRSPLLVWSFVGDALTGRTAFLEVCGWCGLEKSRTSGDCLTVYRTDCNSVCNLFNFSRKRNAETEPTENFVPINMWKVVAKKWCGTQKTKNMLIFEAVCRCIFNRASL